VATRDPGLHPPIVWLDGEDALDPRVTGAKAANLARAAARGLPVLPGFVVTTDATDDERLGVALEHAWRTLSDGGASPLAVRSSSTVEDSTTSSMAGQFTTVLDVRGWAALRDAVSTVLASAAHPHLAPDGQRPMAVLVQPMLRPVCGGVLFGLDPVSGSLHRVVIEAVPGNPDALVSGRADAVHAVVGRHGRLLGPLGPDGRALLPRARRRRLARLAARAERAFGGPQDVEWAFDEHDRLWLLQARAVTAAGAGAGATGPVLGPGPVAETFPEPLRQLEVDLWVEPLREGIVGALHVTGAVSRRRLASSPVVTTVGGRVAADLELFGIVPRRRRWRALTPLRGARRLAAAWRGGRLRAALPALAGDVIAAVDADLVGVGDLAGLDDAELLRLIDAAGRELVALHGHEVLAGILLRGQGDRSSAAGLALSALRRGRADGLTDEEIIGRDPVALVMSAPRVGAPDPLPVSAEVPAAMPLGTTSLAAASLGTGVLGCREALRLRCRWVQELGARSALEAGRRLVRAGVLDRPELVREMTVAELAAAVLDRRVPADLARRAARSPGAPLPVAFRLAAATPVPVATPGSGRDGLPASAGRAAGPVCQSPASVRAGQSCILVVDTLDPRLASLLPDIAGLVAETGSALSHLAILAREMRVPTVCGVRDARARFPAGTHLLVDGGTGEVRALSGDELR
jgi:pyruvate,water dikinase